MKPIHPKRLLLTSPHNLGDFIAKVPLIRLIKRRFARLEILVLARNYVKPLVELFPEITQFVSFDSLFSKPEDQVIQTLKDLKVDTCLHVVNVARQIGPDVIYYAQKAQIPNRLGNIHHSRWKLMRHNQFGLTHNLRCSRIHPNRHEFEWNLQFLNFFGYPFSDHSLNWGELLKTSRPPLNTEYLQKNRFNLIVHPGSLGHAKEWKAENYCNLIDALDERVHLIITGTLQEKNRFDFSIFKNKVTDLRGQLSLEEFISLIAHAQGLVAPSTGPIHIASLFKTPTVALFPPDPLKGPKVWGPKNQRATVLQAKEVCSACQNRLVDFDPKLCSCMDHITVEQVIEQIDAWDLDESFV